MKIGNAGNCCCKTFAFECRNVQMVCPSIRYAHKIVYFIYLNVSIWLAFYFKGCPITWNGFWNIIMLNHALIFVVLFGKETKRREFPFGCIHHISFILKMSELRNNLWIKHETIFADAGARKMDLFNVICIFKFLHPFRREFTFCIYNYFINERRQAQWERWKRRYIENLGQI